MTEHDTKDREAVDERAWVLTTRKAETVTPLLQSYEDFMVVLGGDEIPLGEVVTVVPESRLQQETERAERAEGAVRKIIEEAEHVEATALAGHRFINAKWVLDTARAALASPQAQEGEQVRACHMPGHPSPKKAIEAAVKEACYRAYLAGGSPSGWTQWWAFHRPGILAACTAALNEDASQAGRE